MDIQHALIELIQKADRHSASLLLDTWADEHGYDRLLKDVLEPTLLLIGEEWRTAENFTLAQSYMAAKVAEDALLKAAEHKKDGNKILPTKGPVVIGNIEDDFHSLGRRMIGTFLQADGWIVEDLGNDVLAKEFVDKAVEIGARVIGVSAMMRTTAHNIKQLRAELDQRELTGRIQLAVGGAVFLVCPGLDLEVGGDGTTRTAIDAPVLFQRLWDASLLSEDSS
ncbi:cobalamin B12-binding domain-containing protein [Desulforhopalus sp. 52FAK]